MADRCPTCNSPDPKKHPAVQFEGEVSVCPDPWHSPAPVAEEVWSEERKEQWRRQTARSFR